MAMTNEPQYSRFGVRFYYDPLQYENNEVTDGLVDALKFFLEGKKENGEGHKVQKELDYIKTYQLGCPENWLLVKILEIEYRWTHQYGQFLYVRE